MSRWLCKLQLRKVVVVQKYKAFEMVKDIEHEVSQTPDPLRMGLCPGVPLGLTCF